jgi:uncharacterized protein
MKPALLSFLALATIVYVSLCAYLYLFQRSFIYFPTTAADSGPAEELWLEIGNERIRILQLHPGQPDAIIYFGGNAEDVALNIPEFSDFFRGKSVYLVNYRGYGGSTGSPSESGLYRDAEAIFDFANGGHRRVSLIGRSLGAAIATHLAVVRNVDRLVLITPFDSLASLARRFYPLFPTSVLLKDQYDSMSRAHRIKAPVLMVVAGRDEIIPHESSDKLAKALDPALLTLKVIDNTTHNTIGTSHYGRLIVRFLNSDPDAVTR